MIKKVRALFVDALVLLIPSDHLIMNNLGNLAKKTGPTWSREFDVLIRSIGECKSKAEEDAIIAREVDLLKPRLKDAKIDKRSLKEVLVRLTYVEMLGHDASWGHVKALQACSDTNLLTKKVMTRLWCPMHFLCTVSLRLKLIVLGHALLVVYCNLVKIVQVAYLASGLFLDFRSDLIILVVNTLTQDLKSDNYLVGKQRQIISQIAHVAHILRDSTDYQMLWLLAVCTALSAATKLIGLDLINAVLPAVTGLTSHPKELVRKKAVMALHRFQQLDPHHEGPLAGADLDKYYRQALCDKVRVRYDCHVPSSWAAFWQAHKKETCIICKECAPYVKLSGFCG